MGKAVAQAVLIALLGAWLALYWPVVESLRERWTLSQSYSHGYVIVLVAAYFIALRLSDWRHLRIAPAPSALMLLVPVGLIGFFGNVAQIQLLQQLMLPASLWLWIAAVFGWRVARGLFFPIALLYTTIPMWDFLVRPLRNLTVFSTQHFIDAINVPALVIGNRIHLPSGIIEVEDGCSGHNFFMAATVIGLVQAYWSFHAWPRRIAIVLLAMLVGIVSNWVRVILLVLIAYYSEMRNPLIYDHLNFGWMVFAVALVFYFIISRRLMVGDSGSAPSSADSAFAPVSWPRVSAYAVSATLILALFPIGFAWQSSRILAKSDGLPAPARAQPLDANWWPEYQGFDVRQSWHINWGNTLYDMVALTYLEQRRDKKLIYFRNRIADENAIRQPERWSGFGAGRDVRELVIGSERGSRVVWWFYVIDGRVTADNYKARWLMFTSFLRGDSRASLVALSTPCFRSECREEMEAPATEALLKEILARWSAEGVLKTSLTGARQNG